MWSNLENITFKHHLFNVNVLFQPLGSLLTTRSTITHHNHLNKNRKGCITVWPQLAPLWRTYKSNECSSFAPAVVWAVATCFHHSKCHMTNTSLNANDSTFAWQREQFVREIEISTMAGADSQTSPRRQKSLTLSRTGEPYLGSTCCRSCFSRRRETISDFGLAYDRNSV